MQISESKLIEIANYWQAQYEKTGKKGDLANGLIAIKDADMENVIFVMIL